MKRPLLFLLVLSILFTSCSSAFENDVRKLARLTCEIQKLSVKAIRGDEGAEAELKIKEEEATRLEEEMAKKYANNKNDNEMHEKGNQYFEEELKKCMKEK